MERVRLCRAALEVKSAPLLLLLFRNCKAIHSDYTATWACVCVFNCRIMTFIQIKQATEHTVLLLKCLFLEAGYLYL